MNRHLTPRLIRPAAALLLALGAPLLTPSPAAAQMHVSIGNPGGGAAAPVSKAAIDKYAAILNLDDAQKQAAKSLHEAYQTSARESQRKLQDDLKAAQSDLKGGEGGDMTASMQKIPAIIDKHGEASGRLTKQFLDDLKSILTPAQVEQGWPKLERYRRRAAWLRMGPISGSAVDLTQLVEKMKLPADLTTRLRAPLDQYELDIDRVLVERERFEAEAAKKTPNAEARLFDTDAMEKRSKFDRDNATQVRDINRTYQRQLGALLPDAERAAFDEQFQAASFKSIYRETYAAKTLKAAEKFDDLTAEQKERLKNIQETYAREIKAANNRWAEAQQRAEADGKAHAFPVFMPGHDDDQTPADLKEARAARRELEKKTSEQLAQVLTDEQENRLPQRGETLASRGGKPGTFRAGTRVIAHDDGSGQGGVIVMATDDDGPMIMDGDEDESEEGNVTVRQVIIERHDEVPPPPTPPTPATPTPAPATPPK